MSKTVIGSSILAVKISKTMLRLDKAKTMAIGVSLDPTRRIVVRDDAGREVFSEPVYSKPVAV